MPRKPTISHDGRAPRLIRLRTAGMLLAAAAVVAACTGVTDEPPEPAPSSAETEPDPSAVDPQPEPDPDPEPDPAPVNSGELAETWAAFQSAWVEQAAADHPDPAAFQGVAVDPDATVDLLETLRAGGRLVTTEQELWPQFDVDGDRAEVVDCVISTQHPDGQPDSLATVTISWDATAIVTDDGWLIDTARPGELFCIAEELNDELLAAYTTWLEAHTDWYEPPDPEHPLLQATMAEPGLSDMRAVLADDRDAGIAMRFPHDTRAVVTEVDLESARITDCYEAPDGYGAFDIESGDRRADIVPAPEPSQLNRTVADLERTEDGWRVSGWRWEEQNNCDPGETRYVPN